MYEGSQSVIELLEKQNNKTLTKGEVVMVFKKIIEDSEKMGERMTHLETRMSSLESKVDSAINKIDMVAEIVSKKQPTFFEKIIAFKDYKYFWFLIFIILGIICSVLGVPLTSYTGLVSLF